MRSGTASKGGVVDPMRYWTLMKLDRRPLNYFRVFFYVAGNVSLISTKGPFFMAVSDNAVYSWGGRDARQVQ